jgi:hypothetical protein
MKNKTLAAWLTFLFGPLGFHRFYLFGLGDTLGWLLPIPTALGFYGFERISQYGRCAELVVVADIWFHTGWHLSECHCVWADDD